MKPSPMQYIFASDWPAKCYLLLLAVISVLISSFALGRGSLPPISVLRDWHFVLLTLFASMSVFFGLLRTTSFVFNPIYDWRAKLNGAPFNVGDCVHILVGPYRGRVAKVYSVERRKIRVELGEQSKNNSTDVFSFIQVYREHKRRTVTETRETIVRCGGNGLTD